MSNATIEIRIRHSSEGEPRHLMHWPADRLDEVIPLISGWGLVFSDLGTTHDSDADYSGQFVVTNTHGFFEVVIVEDDGSEE